MNEDTEAKLNSEIPALTSEKSYEDILLENKQRLSFIIIIGGVIFAVLITIILVLIFIPIPPGPGPRPIPLEENPYKIASFTYNDDRNYTYILLNERNLSSGGLLGTDIKNSSTNFEPLFLKVNVVALDDHVINIKIYDANNTRFEPPIFAHSASIDDDIKIFQHYSLRQLGFSVQNDPFGFKLVSNNHSLISGSFFSTINKRLFFFDKYIELAASLQSPRLYGMVDHGSTLALQRGTNYTIWNTNQYQFDNFTANRHSGHPFLLNQLKNDNFIGIFMHNANAMEFESTTSIPGSIAHWRMTGGIIDMYIIFEGDAQFIIRKYHHLIGHPYAMPFWSMGLIYSGINWNQTSELKKVADGFKAAEIPLDTIGADMEITKNNEIFTVNDNFKDLGTLVDTLHNPSAGYNMHFITTIIPTIRKDSAYKYSNLIETSNAGLLNCDKTLGLYIGTDFQGNDAYLPDFLNKNIDDIWFQGMDDLYNLIHFDGIKLVGNEPSILNKTYPNSSDPNCHLFDDLPFRPVDFGRKSIPINSRHQVSNYNLTDNVSSDFNLHNLYCVASLNVTATALHGIFDRIRPFLMTRSTSPSAGYYSSLINGENPATYEIMKESIISLVSFSMFGVSHIGSYIGAFSGPLDDNLFMRWFELGSFYPLAMIEEGGNPSSSRNPILRSTDCQTAARNALLFRYSILRFYYTKLIESHLWGGAAVHPLFFEFPVDDTTFNSDITDSTFMISNTLYVTPVIYEHYETINVYFPNWRFINLNNFDIVNEYNPELNNTVKEEVFDCRFDKILVFMKGGSIISFQGTGIGKIISTTADLLESETLLLVVPDHFGKAYGSLIYDNNGRIVPDPNSNTYRHYSFTYFDKRLRFNKLSGFDYEPTSGSENFTSVMIIDPINAKDVQFACVMDRALNVYQLEFATGAVAGTITIWKGESLENIRITFNSIESIVFGGKMDHNFCNPAIKVSHIDIYNNDREMTARLSTYNPSELQLSYKVIGKLLQNNLMSIQAIMDQEVDPWIVPDVLDLYTRNTVNSTIGFDEFGFRMANDSEDFYFEFVEQDDRTNFIWTTRNLRFSYQDNFIHFKAMIKSKHIFGLGERVKEFDLPDGLYTMMTRDALSPYETGRAPGNNMYGQHPFYMFQLSDPHFFAGVLILTSNPIDIRIRHLGLVIELDHILTGGILDMFFISKGNAEHVIRTYHSLIGRPYQLPYWAFGYHQSRWGYSTLDILKGVVQKFNASGIPLDVIWSDIDYMDRFRNFEIDPVRFNNLSGFVQDIKNKGIQWVPIVDAGIAKQFDYSTYQDIIRLVCSIQSARTNLPLIGIVWPGYVVFTDWVHPSAPEFWESNLQKFWNNAAFDGIWLDMNEAANFCDGECPDEIHYKIHNFPRNFYDDLYYLPGHRPFEKGTLSMDAYHYKDSAGVNRTEFNLHSMYGFYSAKTTYEYFHRKRQRGFILTRSSFVGSGRYTSHWLGDNYATFEYLGYSIPGIMNFNLFGIPHTGSDVCGFNGGYSFELCARWYQLGGFYPFFRAHNMYGESSKEPYVEPNLISVFKRAMTIRYGLLRYMYTRYMHVARFGGTMFRPFLFDFPDDPIAYSYINTEFLFGSAILVAPVLNSSVSTQEVYFPSANWYDLNGNLIYKKSSNVSGGKVNISANLLTDAIPWYIREGHIITWQDGSKANTVYDMKGLKINLKIYPFTINNTAFGTVYYDHDDWDTLFKNEFHDFAIRYENRVITFDLILNQQFVYHLQYNWDESIDSIMIFNSASLNKIQCAVAYDDRDKTNHTLTTSFSNNVLTITPKAGSNYDLNLVTSKNVTLLETGCSSMNNELSFE